MAREPRTVQPLPPSLANAGQAFRDRLGLPTFAPAPINPNAVTAYRRPSRVQVGLSGVAGDSTTAAIGGVRSLVGGTGYATGRDNTRAAFDSARAVNPEQFARDQSAGLIGSLALGGVGGLATRTLTKAATRPGVLNAVGNQLGNAVAVAKPAAAIVTGRNVADEVANPQSETRTDLRANLANVESNLRAGNGSAAAGGVTRAAIEGALDFTKNAAPLPSRDTIASYMGGVAGAGPANIVTGPAQPSAATIAAQPAPQPRTSTPDQAAAFDRQLSMFGQGPGMGQAAPQAPAALKDDLAASLDGLSIRQVLELAKAMPSPGATPKPPSAKDQMGYQIFNLLNEDLASVVGDPAATPEQKRAARERYQASLQLMYNTPGGLMTGFEE